MNPGDSSLTEVGGCSEAGCLHCSGIAAVGSSLSLHTGAAMLPHSEKANKAGEDAFFISECGTYFGAPLGLNLREGLGIGLLLGHILRTCMCRCFADMPK